VKFGQFKDLRIDLKAMPGAYMPDTALLFFEKTITRKFFSGWSMYPFAGRKVEKILPVTGHSPFL
jgi:hypothetical protein